MEDPERTEEQNRFEELLVLVEELEDAVIAQDEELGERGVELVEARAAVATLTQELASARGALRVAESKTREESSRILQSMVEEKDRAIAALRRDNLALRAELCDKEKLLELAAVPTLTQPLPSTNGLVPESAVVVRRSLPSEQLKRMASQGRADAAHEFTPRDPAREDEASRARRRHSSNTLIEARLASGRRTKQAWTDSPPKHPPRPPDTADARADDLDSPEFSAW